MPGQKRVRRTPEQLVAALDEQIEALRSAILETEAKKEAALADFDRKNAALRGKIAVLEEKKKAMLAPKKRKPRRTKAQKIQELVKQAQKSGLKLDEIAEKLGVATAG